MMKRVDSTSRLPPPLQPNDEGTPTPPATSLEPQFEPEVLSTTATIGKCIQLKNEMEDLDRRIGKLIRRVPLGAIAFASGFLQRVAHDNLAKNAPPKTAKPGVIRAFNRNHPLEIAVVTVGPVLSLVTIIPFIGSVLLFPLFKADRSRVMNEYNTLQCSKILQQHADTRDAIRSPTQNSRFATLPENFDPIIVLSGVEIMSRIFTTSTRATVSAGVEATSIGQSAAAGVLGSTLSFCAPSLSFFDRYLAAKAEDERHL